MKQYADLHVHTSMSDGSDTAQEVLARAQENQVSFLSITDHNTVSAYSQAVFGSAAGLGVKLIPGVELDAVFQGKQYHLLAYGIDIKNSGLREACAHNAAVQEESNLSLLRRMERDGLGVSEKEYHGYEIPKGRGGWKLLNYLLDIGMTGSLLEGLKYYGQYGVDSNQIPFLSLEEAVRVVKEASGIPVLAHPGEQIPYNQYDRRHDGFWAALEALLGTGIEGVECIHPLHGFAMQEELIALCSARGLFISGGTDYHGSFFSKQKQTIGGQLIALDTVKKLVDAVSYS